MKLSYRHYFVLAFSLVSISTFVWYFSRTTIDSPSQLKEKTFSRLEQALQTKKLQAISYLEKQKQAALSLAENEVLKSKFRSIDVLHKDYKSRSKQFENIERTIQEMFVNELSSFYDLLFINGHGEIIFTIKKEDDYRKNIYDSQFDGLGLQKAIDSKKFAFVDYEYYAASREPASFYVIPVYNQQEFVGHFILQLSINQINNIFAQRDGLGKTGEVYLVNDNQLMITDSRFINSSTALKKKINTKAIELVRKSGNGQAIIRDYRDKWVFSHFSEFNFEGVHWYVLAEIDEDEILTDYYSRYEELLYPKIAEYLVAIKPELNNKFILRPELSSAARVDVGEFNKQNAGTAMYTQGVATCTALVLSNYGRFTYLAHITPTDAIYNDGWLHRKKLGELHTDMLSNIMKRITYEDIRPVEMSQMKFVLAAPDIRAAKTTINRLLTYGVLLNQITIHYVPGQYSMNLLVSDDHKEVTSQWKAKAGSGVIQINNSSLPSVVDILKQQIHYS